MENDAISVINAKLKDSRMEVKITENYHFDHFGTINKIELYRASQFKHGPKDKKQKKKYFMNIVNDKCGDVTKNIDIDTKDILVKSKAGKGKYLNSLVYRDLLVQWMKDNGIARFFNQVVERLPVYGQVIVKHVGGLEIEIVPLKMLFRDPAQNGIQSSSYISQRHKYQPDFLTSQIEDGGWSEGKVKIINEAFHANKDSFINVYETYMWVNEEILGKKVLGRPAETGKPIKALIIAALDVSTDADGSGSGGSDGDDSGTTVNEVLFKEEWTEDYPYKEVNMFEIEGRALGLGIIELLFDSQQRWNELANQKSRSMRLSSKHIMQSRSNTIQKNIDTDVDDGFIMRADSPIEPVNIQEKNLGAYAQEEGNIREISRNLSNAGAVDLDNLPSGTPYRLGALATQEVSKLHEFIQQKLSIFFKDILNDWIDPEFKKQIKANKIVEIMDSDILERMVKNDITRRTNEAVRKFIVKNKTHPSKQEIQLLRESLQQDYDSVEFAEITEEFLKFDHNLDIIITGESVDLNQRIESMSNAVMLLSQNPEAMTNPDIKKLVSELLELVGISPTLIGNNNAAPNGAPVGSMPRSNQLINDKGQTSQSGLDRVIQKSIA